MVLVGTEKRERQKANRQLKLEELNREAEKRKKKRLALRIGLGIAAAVAVVYGLSFLGRSDNKPVVDSATNASLLAALNSTTVPTTGSATESTVAESTTTTPVTFAPLTTVTVVAPTAQAAGNLPCPKADGSSGRIVAFPSVQPPTCIDRTKTYTANVTTNQGDFTIVLDPKIAPTTVNSFVYLARYHFFDNTLCHRIVPGFVIQCGDPSGTGSGGPGYNIPDELPAAGEYKVGSIVMANESKPNTGSSQFFIVTGAKGVALPPSYSLFGQVTDGLDKTIKDIDALGVADGVPSKKAVNITGVTITEK